MEIEYKRDGNQNYMILARKNQTEESYQEKMVLSAALPGLLPVSLHNLNGEGMYYYDIRSRQSLKTMFEYKLINKEELSLIFAEISELLRVLENHLLSVQYLVLNPECMYMNPELTSISFCFYPDYSVGCQENFLELSEFILQRVDHGDDEAKTLAYQYDSNVAKGEYDPAELLKNHLTQEKTEVTLEELLWENESTEKESYYHTELGAETEEENQTVFPHIKWLIICGILILLAAGGYLVALLNPSLLSFLGLSQKDYIVAGAVIAALAGGLLAGVVKLFHYRERKCEVQEEETAEKEKEKRELLVDKVEEEEYLERKEVLTDMEEKTTLLSEISDKGTARLEGKGEAGSRICLVIDDNPYIVGKLSGKANGIIEDTRISRVHAAIRFDTGRYYISDLNSTNGTCLNGELLNGTDTYELHHGDMLRFAGITMHFLEH